MSTRKGYTTPQGPYNYKSRIDGLYYNGYLGSPDAAEAVFGEACRQVAARIEKDLLTGTPFVETQDQLTQKDLEKLEDQE